MADGIDRRRFLKSLAAGSTIALASWPDSAIAAPDSVAPGCKYLTVNQAALVQAVADQIVPADQDPGGKDAGVLFFVDQLLAGPFGTFYKERYTTGLRMIDNASRKQFGGNFASLKFEQQTALLKEFESGKAAGADGQAFFSLIRLHSMEGYYGDPAHGGNRNKASWKMINFEG